MGIKHKADSAGFRSFTINKLCSGLTALAKRTSLPPN